MSSLVSVILFFRIIEIGYGFRASQGHGHHGAEGHAEVLDEAPLSMLIPTLAVSIAILLIGIYNQKILSDVIASAVPKF
jgi:hypothetical protein